MINHKSLKMLSTWFFIFDLLILSLKAALSAASLLACSYDSFLEIPSNLLTLSVRIYASILDLFNISSLIARSAANSTSTLDLLNALYRAALSAAISAYILDLRSEISKAAFSSASLLDRRKASYAANSA